MSRLLFHECLGRGGYGEVYRCTWVRRHVELEVAVKVLNASVAKGSQAQKRLKDEARLLGALTHPGILRVYDLVELRGSVAMLAEYVPGADLDRCVLEGLPSKALLECLSRVASALAAAWGDLSPVSGRPLRLVHRDVKPENIRISPSGEVKLLDFGVARAAEMRREAQTATNTVMGSYRYMAPERFDTGLEPHPSVDVFAIGCILYEGLAFRRLFEHLSMREMLVLSLPGTERYEDYIEERLGELPPGTQASTIQLIRRLVSRDPAHRPMPGRLAALCDDEADRQDGQGLSPWCRAQEWGGGPINRGEWTDLAVDVKTAPSGQHELAPGFDGQSGSNTLKGAEFETRDFLQAPGFAPGDLRPPADAPTEPTADDEETAGPTEDTHPDTLNRVEIPEDEPTQGTPRPLPPPPPPVSSSTRDPAPARMDAPPVPVPKPPEQSSEALAPSSALTYGDPDETLQQPRTFLPPPAPDAPPTNPVDVPEPPARLESPPPRDEDGVVTREHSVPQEVVTFPVRTRDRDFDPDAIDEFDAIPSVADPDRTQTEAVDLARVREKIEEERRRFRQRRLRTDELEATEDHTTTESPRDSIPDDLFDVPITREANLPDGVLEAVDPDEVDTDEPAGPSSPSDEPTQVLETADEPDPTPVPRPVSKAARRARPPVRPAAGSAIIANLAVLGLLLALAFVILVVWVVLG
jgi:serine/threonine-protein kinase